MGKVMVWRWVVKKRVISSGIFLTAEEMVVEVEVEAGAEAEAEVADLG